MSNSSASLRRDGDSLVFAGALLLDAVPTLWRQALSVLDGVHRFDLTAVSRIDSAALALLAELAARAGEVRIDGTPEGLAELGAAYRLSPALAYAA
jgi:phospholipid transport system transporter-binding protein